MGLWEVLYRALGFSVYGVFPGLFLIRAFCLFSVFYAGICRI